MQVFITAIQSQVQWLFFPAHTFEHLNVQYVLSYCKTYLIRTKTGRETTTLKLHTGTDITLKLIDKLTLDNSKSIFFFCNAHL